jgi:hypothetical protein
MSDEQSAYQKLKEAADSEGVQSAFDELAAIFESEKKYPQLFDALLMKKRNSLGLPLEGAENLRDLPETTQAELEEYYVTICRRVGGLFLADGNVQAAWPYFRAIDEPQKVAKTIEKWNPPEGDDDDGEETDVVIDIALGQGAHPTRGFELVLSQYGVCRAVTTFEHQFPHGPEVKQKCARLLVDRIYADLLENLLYDVKTQKGKEAEQADIRSLVSAHPELFEGHGYHIDISHLQSVVRFSSILEKREGLDKALQLCEYGRKIPRDFQSPDPPPFDDFYNDYRIFFQALLGTGVDGAVRYFTQKADQAEVDEDGKHFPAEVLIHLLYRVGRYEDALDQHEKYLKDYRGALSVAPSLLELSDRMGSYERLLGIAEAREDLLQYAAALAKQAAADSSTPAG